MEGQQDQELKNVLKNNQVEEINDLLDIKRQLMALEQVNNMHQVTILEKDDLIKELQAKLKNAENSSNKAMSIEQEAEYLRLLDENSELKKQIAQLSQTMALSNDKLLELAKLQESEEARKRKALEDMKGLSKLQEMELKISDLDR